MPTIYRNTLWRQATARWTEIRAISTDLHPAIALQQQLVQLTLDAAEQIDQPLPATLSAVRVLEKWQRGVPALRNEEVAIPEFLRHLLPSFCTALAEGGAGDSVLHIRDALIDGHIDAGSLLSVSLARNRKAMRTSALHMGFSPDLIWLVGELGSSPLAHHLQVQLLAGITQWDRGYCPFCGSWPVFIESRHGLRELRCSFCALGWTLQSHRCIYCGNGGDNFIAAAPDVSRARHRVELCGQCACYTKVIEVAEPIPFPLLAIEDLASIGLDHGAMERQYGRPDLYDLDSIEPLKSC